MNTGKKGKRSRVVEHCLAREDHYRINYYTAVTTPL